MYCRSEKRAWLMVKIRWLNYWPPFQPFKFWLGSCLLKWITKNIQVGKKSSFLWICQTLSCQTVIGISVKIQHGAVAFVDNLLLPTLFFSNRLATSVKITYNVKGLTYFSFSLTLVKAKLFWYILWKRPNPNCPFLQMSLTNSGILGV